MSRRQVLGWGISILLVIPLLGGCGGASPTPIVTAPEAPATQVPPVPPAALPIATDVLPISTTAPTITTQLTTTDLATTAEGIATTEPVVATVNPIDQPFLMRIDRVSVIVGRGTFLEGRVAHGTLQGNGDVEILVPQNQVLDTDILAIFISNVLQDQVTVGDYAGILVQGIEATKVSAGMLLAEAGEYESYEEALQELQ